MSLFRKIGRTLQKNPLDELLKKSVSLGVKTVLIPWNRGLGDIPLGLYAMVIRIRSFLPEAAITFLTRSDLAEGIRMLGFGIACLEDPTLKRGAGIDITPYKGSFDLILENSDPTYWVSWQKEKLIPKLAWNSSYDSLYTKWNLPSGSIGVHVHSETVYGYNKNWTQQSWETLFSHIQEPIFLLGFGGVPFKGKNVFDLRGKLSLYELLSIVKNQCSLFIGPDSGLLNMLYYLDASFPIDLISIWADTNQGILKLKVPSPNPQLRHTPLISPDTKDASKIPIQDLLACIENFKN